MNELKSFSITNIENWESYVYTHAGLKIYFCKRLNIPTYEEVLYFGASDTYQYFNKTMNAELVEKEGIEIKYEGITYKK